MHSYIREHTIGGIVVGAFRIYAQNFLTIAVAFFLPVLPPAILQDIAIFEGSVGLAFFAFILALFANLLAVAAITIIISDLCLGHRVSIVRAYKRIFGAILLKLLGTNILQMLAIFLGFLPGVIAMSIIAGGMSRLELIVVGFVLSIPGIVAIAWFMFASAIVILERTAGVAALKRSKGLGGTKHLRNIAVILVLMAVGMVFGGLVGFIFALVAPYQVTSLSFEIVLTFIELLVMPLSFIAIVLMYYDLRVRKEAYNLEALAEDLKF